MPERPDPSATRWSREEIAEKMTAFEHASQYISSQRQSAAELGIPRSTLQHWLTRKDTIDANPELVDFFESPVGVAFLHRLVLAAHVVMTLLGPCGIRLVCLFLELAGLDHFVAASYGPQQRVSTTLEKAVVEFGQAERQRLAAGMCLKAITVCEDETFHPQTCLVAIEPVSNFIVVEKYAENRTAATWTTTLQQATAGLAVNIVQATSDEGKGIVKHVQEDLGAHHSPDLFHVQQELIHGPSVALANQERHAEQAVTEAVQQVRKHTEKVADLPGPPSSAAAAELERSLEQARQQEAVARQTLETIVQQREQVQQAIHGISADYHPYALESGAAQSPAELAAALNQHFTNLESVAAQAHLSDHCRQKIAKAKRMLVAMVATLTFYVLTLRAKVEALALPPAMERAVYDQLIPAIYLDLVAEKTAAAAQRHTLKQRAAELLAPLCGASSPLKSLAPEDLRVIEQVAQECAELFQRSSSCVEGRNGQLALRHHSLHRLRDQKLAALTTMHNYFVQRSDGTTAAERFFGAKPGNLFEWVLERVDLPGWPAQKRAAPKPKEYLAPAAAGA
jgi:flagellar biosynthesis chaperone FliJ